MKRQIFILLVGASLLSITPALNAAVNTYANNPTGNSTDFATGVAGILGSISTYTFDTLPTGVLSPSAYPGLTLAATGEFNNVVNGEGPADGNSFSTPLSPGEGLHPVSNYLGSGGGFTGGLTVDFSTPVLGFGLYTIDVFTPSSFSNADNFSLSAYTGADGGGTLLGTATGLQFNFQTDNLYFLGITSSAANIRSVIFSSDGSGSDDNVGLDNLEVASSAGRPLRNRGRS